MERCSCCQSESVFGVSSQSPAPHVQLDLVAASWTTRTAANCRSSRVGCRWAPTLTSHLLSHYPRLGRKRNKLGMRRGNAFHRPSTTAFNKLKRTWRRERQARLVSRQARKGTARVCRLDCFPPDRLAPHAVSDLGFRTGRSAGSTMAQTAASAADSSKLGKPGLLERLSEETTGQPLYDTRVNSRAKTAEKRRRHSSRSQMLPSQPRRSSAGRVAGLSTGSKAPAIEVSTFPKLSWLL